MKEKLNISNKSVFITIMILLIFNTVTCVHFIVSMEPQLESNTNRIKNLEKEIDVITLKINAELENELEEMIND